MRRKKCPWRYIRVCDLEHRKVSVVCTSGLFLAERICKFSIEADESVRVLRYVRVSVKWGFHSTAKDLELIPLYTTWPFINKKCILNVEKPDCNKQGTKWAINFSKSFKALENCIGQAKKALEKIGRSINSPPFSASNSLGTVKIRFEVGYLTESKQRILNVLSLAAFNSRSEVGGVTKEA